MRLTIYFDGQFWVGVVEDELDGKLRAARWVFGPEPSDEEVLGFINQGMLELLSGVLPTVEVGKAAEHRPNPKRAAREAVREMSRTGISTKAQQALQMQREERKKEKKLLSRNKRDAREELQYQMKRQKAKEKHRGH